MRLLNVFLASVVLLGIGATALIQVKTPVLRAAPRLTAEAVADVDPPCPTLWREPGVPAVEPGSCPPPYYDVDGDGYLAPIDALLIINHLNREAEAQNVDGDNQRPAHPR